MYVTSRESFDVGLVLSIECRPQDELALVKANAQQAKCEVEFLVNQGKIHWAEVHLYPISDVDLYNSIN